MNRWLLIAFILCTNSLTGQNTWIPVDFSVDKTIRTMYSDSSNNTLYIGGEFRKVDGKETMGTLSYDSSGWQIIDSTFPFIHPVLSFMRYKSELYYSGFGGIGKLVNGKWDTLDFDGGYSISGLTVLDGELFMGGFLKDIGGNKTDGLAKYNGSTFSDFNGFSDTVNSNGWSMGEVVKHNGSYIFGGNLDESIWKEIVLWDGNRWNNMNGGIPGSGDEWVNDIVVYKSEIYVGGRFFESNGAMGDHILKWDGSNWSKVGNGIKGQAIEDMIVYDGRLWVGGYIDYAGNLEAQNIAVWDGEKWCTTDTGFSGPSFVFEEHLDTLWVAGSTSNYVVKLNPKYILLCDSTVGTISRNKREEYKISPNPSTGLFHISSPESSELELYSLEGKLVFKIGIEKGIERIKLPLEIPDGMYIIIIRGNNGSRTTERIILSR